MSERPRFFAFLTVAVAVALAACSSSDDDDSDDCAQAAKINPPTAQLGETCALVGYGSCAPIGNCVDGQGTCVFDPGEDSKHCRASCEASSDCTSGQSCVSGYCQPAATCMTSCDGTTCCEYHVDPNDPTKCVQGACSLSN